MRRPHLLLLYRRIAEKANTRLHHRLEQHADGAWIRKSSDGYGAHPVDPFLQVVSAVLVCEIPLQIN